MARRVSERCMQLIKEYSVLRPVPYLCDEGIVRIGYGHAIWLRDGPLSGADGVPYAYRLFPNAVTLDQAEHMLDSDIKAAERMVCDHVAADLTQPQYDALVSLVSYIGRGKAGRADGFLFTHHGGQSRLLERLNDKDYTAAAEEFLVWAPRSGISRARMLRWRKAERKMFLEPTGDHR